MFRGYFEKWKVRVNVYVALLLSLFVMLFILFISRFIFYWLNPSYFPGISFSHWLRIMRGGFKFDLAAVLYLNIVFIFLMLLPFRFRYKNWYQVLLRWLFYITNSLGIIANCIDLIYFRFTLRRSTTDVFSEFSNEKGKGKFFLVFILDYWYVVLICIGLIALLVFLYNRIRIRVPEKINPWVYYPVGVLLIPVILAGVLAGIRGDLKHSTRPFTMSNAGEYVNSPGEIPLVLNTPFCIIRTFSRTFYHEEKFFTAEEIDNVYTPVQELHSDQPFRPDNVVVIILESFGREAVGYYNKDLKNGTYKGYTPFLDSLISVSATFTNSFANGRKSIDAIPSVLTSIPSGENPFVLTPYASDKLNSLPQILKSKGYNTSFFHGAPDGSMGFKAFVNLVGVDHYYGKDEFNNDKEFDGLWGIWDEPFFQYFAHTLDTIKKPFFTSIFSVSSHHPFKVPKQYEGVFPKGELPIHQCMGYTDMALRKFFATASKMSWFKNTLFVLTADHATISNFPEYQTSWGYMSIPIVFYHPGDSTLRTAEKQIAQQTDIMPSVLDYLHYSGKIVSFGKSIFSPAEEHFVVNYNNGFQLIKGDYLLRFDGQKASGLYDFVHDRLMNSDLKEKQPALRDSMEMKIKAYIQQYHNRLIGDKMRVE